MSKPTDYVWIARWCRFMGSAPYYVELEQERACKDGAPLTAIHRDITDPATRAYRWATVDEVKSERARHALGLPARDGDDSK